MPPTDDPILDAARDLSERDPNWTMTSLAREARVSRATLYRRFGSREGLLSAYAAARTPRALLDELTLDPSGPLRELLQVLATHAIAHLTAHRAALGLALAVSPEEQPIVAHLRALEAEGRSQLAAWLGTRVEAGELSGAPTALARAFVGMLAASVLARDADDDPNPADEVAWIVDLFLDGCAGHGAAS